MFTLDVIFLCLAFVTLRVVKKGVVTLFHLNMVSFKSR